MEVVVECVVQEVSSASRCDFMRDYPNLSLAKLANGMWRLHLFQVMGFVSGLSNIFE